LLPLLLPGRACTLLALLPLLLLLLLLLEPLILRSCWTTAA
jgi:hypothetical protein